MKNADLVILGDAIFDSVSDEPFSGGIAVSGEKIEYVGSKNAALRFADHYTVIKDFGDKLILPGICDCHAHLDGSVKKDCAVVAKDLDRCMSEEECALAVRAFADEHPGLERIHGSNWALSNFGANPKPPTKASLDRYFPDTPVYLFGADGHVNWINSKAIEECNLAKLVADNPQFPEDFAPRDENGGFTGFLKESIGFMVHNLAFKLSAEDRVKYYAEFTKMINSMGITAMSELSFPTPVNIIANNWPLKAMENRGELTARYYLSILPDGAAPFSTEQIREMDPFKEFFNSDKLRITTIKTILDGVPSSYTAAMLEPYTSDPSTKGDLRYPPEVPMAWYKEANRLGYSVRVHCCGDAAVRLALDCFEESNRVNDNSGIRNAVEHMECLSDDDIPRFAELGVIASMQPAHLVLSKDELAGLYGDRAKNEWCFRKLINAGATIAVSSDSPVVDINPYWTIYMAVTRKGLDGTQYGLRTLDQVLTLPEVLKAYTATAAYVNNMEHKVGTLEAGKYADITVADRNLFAIPADELKDCRSVFTVFNGKIVYEV